MAETVLITSFASFGDLIYQSPFIRFLYNLHGKIDVWCRNYEPFLNSPYIRDVYKLDSFLCPPADDFFWGNVYRCILSSINLPQSNIHTVDFFTVGAARFVLRDCEKDLDLFWTKKDEETVREMLRAHGLITAENREEANFTVICPGVTWPSRTFSLEFYQKIISLIQSTGDKVVIVGKNLDYATYDPDLEKGKAHYASMKIKESKQLYAVSDLPKGVIDLTNQLTLQQLGALYSLTKIAVNTENGNHVVSCTNDTCWNLYLPSLTAPEFRVPYRKGSQRFKSVVVGNTNDYYPASDYKNCTPSLTDAPALFPTAEQAFEGYLLANKGFKSGATTISEIR